VRFRLFVHSSTSQQPGGSTLSVYYATSWHDRINPSRPSHRHDGNHGTAHAPTISGINQTKYRRQRPGGRYFEGFVSDIRSFLHASRKDVKVARHETRISDSVVWLNAAGLGLEARMSVPTSIWGQNLGPSRSQWPKYRSRPQLSMGWVDPWVGLVWVGLGRNFAVFNGWVGSTIAKVVKFWKAYVNALKARLDKIWLHRAVKYVSCIGLGRVVSQILPLVVSWVGSVSWWVGLDRVTRNGPMENSGLGLGCLAMQFAAISKFY